MPSSLRPPPHLCLPVVPSFSESLSESRLPPPTPPQLRRASSPAVPGRPSDADSRTSSSRRNSGGARPGGGSARGGGSSAHPTDVQSRNLSIFPSRRRGSPSVRRSGDDILERVLKRRARSMRTELQVICWDIFSANNTVDDLLELCYQGDLEKIHYLLVDRMRRVMEEVRLHDSRILRRQSSTGDLGNEEDDSDSSESSESSERADSEGSPSPTVHHHQSFRPICLDEQLFENTLTDFLAVLWYTCLPVAEGNSADVAVAEAGNATTALLDEALAARGGEVNGPTEVVQVAAMQEGQARSPSRSRLPAMGNIKQKCRRIIQESIHTRRRRGIIKSKGWYAKIKRFLPWRVRFLLGGEVVGSAERWSQIQYTTLEFNSLWDTFGQPTHWFTLEFTDDAALEKGFQVDFAIRARKYPYWYCFLAVACMLLYVWLRFELNNSNNHSITFVRQFMSEPAVLLIFAALIKLVMEVVFFETSLWFLENYYLIYLIFGAFCGTAVMLWMYIAPLVLNYYTWEIDESLTFAVIIVSLAGLFKLRFLHVVVLAVYFFVCVLSLRWIAVDTPALTNRLFEQAAPDVLFYFGSVALIATIQYMYEALCRKDYVLSLTLATESDRSERLLSNVLPGSIIQQLKENQDDQIRQEAELARRGSDQG
ncbi:Nitrogen permease regulator 2, partial [Perkinsus olseni]